MCDSIIFALNLRLILPDDWNFICLSRTGWVIWVNNADCNLVAHHRSGPESQKRLNINFLYAYRTLRFSHCNIYIPYCILI